MNLNMTAARKLADHHKFNVQLKLKCDIYMPGWTAVKSNVPINYDIEKSPLQIKTNSQVGSDEKIYDVSFYNAAGNDAGGVFLNFSSPPQYWLYGCSLYYTNFPTALPSETDNKVWTLTKTTGIHRVVIHCNDKEVLNVVLSDTTCNESDWRTMWMRDVEMINFPSCCDTTYYYRPGENYNTFHIVEKAFFLL